MKNFLNSKTIHGILIMVSAFLTHAFGVPEIVSPELATNIADGHLNTEDWVKLGTNVLFGLGAYKATKGRWNANTELTMGKGL